MQATALVRRKKGPMNAGGRKSRGSKPASGAEGGSERRRHRRYDVEDVLGHLRLSFDAKILNLSLDGMALETHGWLRVGRRYSFKIRHSDASIDLGGMVSWCTLVRTEHVGEEILPVYRAGVQFEDALTEKALQVRGFLEQNALKPLDSTRAFGRFRLRRGGAVDVDVCRDFVVRRLSLSGLLLETDLLPELDARFELELRLGEREIQVPARVAYVERLEMESGEPRAEIGMEFLSLTMEARRLLEQLMERELEERSG